MFSGHAKVALIRELFLGPSGKRPSTSDHPNAAPGLTFRGIVFAGFLPYCVASLG